MSNERKKRKAKKDAGELPKRKGKETRTNKSNVKSLRGNSGGEKQKKIRVNDPETGRLAWVTQKELPAFNARAEKVKARRAEEQIKKVSLALDVPEEKVKGGLYDNANSYKKIKAVIDQQGGRLRYRGRFITNEAQEAILNFAKLLDKNGVDDYNLTTLLQVPDIARKVVIIQDETPKELFYWNIQNKLTRGELGTPEVVVIDYEGKQIYKGKDLTEASKHINKMSRRAAKWEKLLDRKKQKEPYITIPVYETKRNGELLRLKIDYSGIETRLSEEAFKKYRKYL